MSSQPSSDELRAAWLAMRHQRGCAAWPPSFDQVMSDPIAGRLVRLQAAFRARKAVGRPDVPTAHPPRVRPIAHSTDLKRAAAGDRDD